MLPGCGFTIRVGIGDRFLPAIAIFGVVAGFFTCWARLHRWLLRVTRTGLIIFIIKARSIGTVIAVKIIICRQEWLFRLGGSNRFFLITIPVVVFITLLPYRRLFQHSQID